MTSVISIENPDFQKEVRAASSALFLLQPIFNFDLSTAIFDFYMDIRNVTFQLPLQIHISAEYITLDPHCFPSARWCQATARALALNLGRRFPQGSSTNYCSLTK